MRALNATKHKTNLTNILIDIYKDSILAPVLGFKGGTAAMLFYKLPRLSIDLDFDLVSIGKNDLDKNKAVIDNMTGLLATKYTIKDQSEKFNTLFWLVSYGKGLTNIKVEISTRKIPYNHYELKPFYGVKVMILDIKDMMAHKMVAAMQRRSTANRDLFDIHFFLKTRFASEVNYNIIKERTGKAPKEFYLDLLDFVQKIEPQSVLTGLGEILNESQKDWAKVKLVEELQGLIQRQIDLL